MHLDVGLSSPKYVASLLVGVLIISRNSSLNCIIISSCSCNCSYTSIYSCYSPVLPNNLTSPSSPSITRLKSLCSLILQVKSLSITRFKTSCTMIYTCIISRNSSCNCTRSSSKTSCSISKSLITMIYSYTSYSCAIYILLLHLKYMCPTTTNNNNY